MYAVNNNNEHQMLTQAFRVYLVHLSSLIAHIDDTTWGCVRDALPNLTTFSRF